ncbi:MAG TPA: Crp/Fnr family transcriptional regulator [Chitinophagaceae bacterium]|mgnify:CR=1 FL=1|nr:Crp/Fnr family transcriptional regulator [Chitinophagaceae bacterium]
MSNQQDWKTLFSQFEPGLTEAIEQDAVIKEYKAGETVMRTGQFIKSAALVIEGRIKIYRENQEGGEFLMYFLGPGQACAVSLICALQARGSEVTAVAEEDSTLLMLPVQAMEQLMSEYKSWYQFVIQTYRSRFDELLNVIDHVAFRNMDERLRYYLQRYTDNTGRKNIELSHQQIADDLHSSREVISRLLKKMEQRGELVLYRNMISLK